MASCILLIAVCFMPWTYHADVQKNFTGFFSQNDAYGKPGRYFVFFSILVFILISLQKIWAQRVHLFIAGIMIAYALKTYILYTSCYNAYCPEKRIGIFLVVFLSVVIFASSLFSDIKIPEVKKQQ